MSGPIRTEPRPAPSSAQRRRGRCGSAPPSPAAAWRSRSAPSRAWRRRTCRRDDSFSSATLAILAHRVGEDEVAADAQVVDGGGADLVRVLERLHADLGGELGDLAAEVGERVDELLHRLVRCLPPRRRPRSSLPNFFSLAPLSREHLAAQQVERLDRVRALVDHVDARVANELLHSPFADVAVPAEHLQAVRGRDPGVVGEERLDDRRQQRDQVGAFLLLFLVVARQLACRAAAS